MTKRTSLGIAMGVLVAFLMAVAPAAAQNGNHESSNAISIAMQGHLVGATPDGGNIAGSWQAAGAFTDAGTYTEHYVLSNANTYVVATKTLTSAFDGSTILLEARANIVWLSPTTGVFSGGSWRFTGGTGRYTGIHGGGRPGGVGGVDLAAGTIAVVHVGRAGFDHDSDADG